MAALQLRDDYDGATLRALARQVRRAEVRNRLLGIAAAYDGVTRTAAAEIAGIGRQVLRDWIIRFNAEGPSGLYSIGFRGGDSEKLSEEHKAVLHGIIQRAELLGTAAPRPSHAVMIEEFGARTGRPLAVRSLSKHIAEIRTQPPNLASRNAATL